MLFCISLGLALLMAVILFRLFFGNLPDFIESICRPSPSSWKVAVWGLLVLTVGITSYRTLRHIPALARHRQPEATNAVAADAKSSPTVVQARTDSKSVTPAVAGPPAPREATARGVKLGDTVQISALQPAIALRSALITSMDETQLTVRANSGSYTILWKDLTSLRAAASTNHAGPN